MIHRSSSGGTSPTRSVKGVGCAVRIAAIVSADERPANARRPAIISCSTQPNEKTSLGALVGSPRTCSGDMYAAVPMMVPGSVTIVALVSSCTGPERLYCARPKSRILTRPSVVRKTFSGLRSRWMTPFACAAARPSAISTPIATALRHGSGESLMRARRVSPSSSSITANVVARSMPTS